MWFISINVEEPITAQGEFDEINSHQNPHGKSKINISLCIRNIYQRTDLEDICPIFYLSRPVFSNLELCLPEKPISPKNIGEALKCHRRPFCKEYLFCNMTRTKMSALFWTP